MEGRPKIAVAALIVALSLLLVTPAEGIDCVQCTSDDSPDCISTPPPARICAPPSKYCITVHESFTVNDTLSLMTRTCSPIDLGHKCLENQSITGGSLTVCHETCNEDNCNAVPFAVDSGGAVASTSITALLAPPLLLLLVRRMLP